MNEIQDANERFNRLWDEIGAKRAVIGDEDKGVEIVIDADLSLLKLIEKIKEAAREGHELGELDESERKSVAAAIDEARQVLENRISEPLRTRVDSLLTHRWNPRRRG